MLPLAFALATALATFLAALVALLVQHAWRCWLLCAYLIPLCR